MFFINRVNNFIFIFYLIYVNVVFILVNCAIGIIVNRYLAANLNFIL